MINPNLFPATSTEQKEQKRTEEKRREETRLKYTNACRFFVYLA